MSKRHSVWLILQGLTKGKASRRMPKVTEILGVALTHDDAVHTLEEKLDIHDLQYVSEKQCWTDGLHDVWLEVEYVDMLFYHAMDHVKIAALEANVASESDLYHSMPF